MEDGRNVVKGQKVVNGNAALDENAVKLEQIRW